MPFPFLFIYISIHSFIHSFIQPPRGSIGGTHVRHTPVGSPGQHEVLFTVETPEFVAADPVQIYICTCKRLYLLETLICLIMTMEWFTLQLLWRPYFQNIHLYCSLGMVDLLQDTTLIVQANTLTDLILKVSVHMLTCFNYIIWHLNPKPVSLAFNALLQSKSRSKISERCLLKFQWNSQNFPDPRCPKCSQQTSDRVIR